MGTFCLTSLRRVNGDPDITLAVRFVTGPLRDNRIFRIVSLRAATGPCLAPFEALVHEYDGGRVSDTPSPREHFCLEDVESGDICWSDLTDRRWQHVLEFPDVPKGPWPASQRAVEHAVQAAWSSLVLAMRPLRWCEPQPLILVYGPDKLVHVYSEDAWVAPATQGLLPWHPPVGARFARVNVDGTVGALDAPVSA